ncbi:outer membrane protein assembly factor BamE [Ligilactobacillus animalis]|uniref:outer membrane protein assembly factor BamE domain-containing protein n=1 Tax=Ligilactobacillus animalis TaxID=1605 RepID=UPI00384B1CFB
MKINHGLMLVSACLSLGLVETVNYQTTTQTIQADSTANKNFKQIKLGMNKRQVIDTLGKPAHDKYEDNVWTYPLKDQKSVSLIFKKDTLENISDRTAISSKNSVVKKATKKTIKQNINTAFSNYFKQAKEYAKAGQTEFAWSTMIQKVTFDGDDKLKITTVDGFNTTPAHEKDVIAKKIADLGRSFLHRYNKQDFDLKFYENGHKIGSSDNDQLTKFEWKVQK